MNGSPLPVPAPATASVTPRRLSVGVMVLVAVTTLVACGLVTTAALLALIPGRALPLLTQPLPGLEVGLPPGHYDRSAIGAYRNGKLTVKASALRSLEVAVEWEPGEGMDDDDMQRVAGALSALIPGNVHDVQRNVPVPAPGLSRPRSLRILVDGKIALWMTEIACGGRHVSVTTGGVSRDAETLHKRVVGTLGCHPDARKEPGLADVPVTMGAPAGWRRLHTNPGEVAITDGRFALVAHSSTGQLDEQAFGKMLPGLFGKDMHLGARVGSAWAFTGSAGGSPYAGWMALRYCPSANQTLMVLGTYHGDRQEADRSHALLDGVHCRRPGEAPEVWPSAP